MHLHALIMHLEKMKNMNARMKASSYAHFSGNGAKMLGQSDCLSFNLSTRGFRKLTKHACTVSARNCLSG